jgi:hypothetical protein
MIGVATTFEKGRRYVARIHLVGPEAMFGRAVDVARKLEDAGFSELAVTGQPQKGAQRTDRFADGDTYWASGTFARPTAVVELPMQVTEVWPLVGPVKPAAAALVSRPATPLLQQMKQPIQVPKWALLLGAGYLLYLESKTPRRR